MTEIKSIENLAETLIAISEIEGLTIEPGIRGGSEDGEVSLTFDGSTDIGRAASQILTNIVWLRRRFSNAEMTEEQYDTAKYEIIEECGKKYHGEIKNDADVQRRIENDIIYYNKNGFEEERNWLMNRYRKLFGREFQLPENQDG